MNTVRVSDDETTNLQASECVCKLQVCIDDLTEKNTSLLKDNAKLVADLNRLTSSLSEWQLKYQELSEDRHIEQQQEDKIRRLECKHQSLIESEREIQERLSTLVKQWECNYNKVCYGRENQDKKMQGFMKDLQHSEQNLKQALDINNHLSNEKLETENKFEKVKSKYGQIYNDKEQLEMVYLTKVKELAKSANTAVEANNRISHLESEKEEILKRISEKEHWFKQLSKIAEAKLTAGNSNIADLNDENRPTKLADKFSELYDNEWTDAFEQVCTVMNENAGIQYLLSVLQASFEFCKKITTRHFDYMKETITVKCAKRKKTSETYSSEIPSLKLEKVEQQQHENIPTVHETAPKKEDEIAETVSITFPNSINPELYKQLLNLKKLISVQMKGSVLQEITRAVSMQFDVPEENILIHKYIAKCVELCWCMGLQEPPLQMIFEISDGGTKFDTNMYKPYTRTGKHVEFIVWPPLFLKEGGPMLMKGVAQGKK